MVLVLKDRTSTTTATIHQLVATVTGSSVFSDWVGLGCGFFLVGATGPSKTIPFCSPSLYLSLVFASPWDDTAILVCHSALKVYPMLTHLVYMIL